ncbi:unnamed protein product [Cuscuta europaea]|uniref:Uncharacterized protein n=1 Tax=Cuscuta europaea TaxID=41803 RepID=A0A9P1EGK4_CUSEU|nr:unnamed protein product [Cuscuta europaea]
MSSLEQHSCNVSVQGSSLFFPVFFFSFSHIEDNVTLSVGEGLNLNCKIVISPPSVVPLGSVIFFQKCPA